MNMVDPDEEREKAEAAEILKQNYSRKNKNKEKSFKFKAKEKLISPFKRSLILYRVFTQPIYAFRSSL